MAQSQDHKHSDVTGEIIGGAMEVLNALRPGLHEKLYENALVIELVERGLRLDQQSSFSVHYKDRFVGKLKPDLIVEEKVIVETKVVEAFTSDHIAQVLGYLAITNLEVGLLLNFKFAELDIKRVAREATH